MIRPSYIQPTKDSEGRISKPDDWHDCDIALPSTLYQQVALIAEERMQPFRDCIEDLVKRGLVAVGYYDATHKQRSPDQWKYVAPWPTRCEEKQS